MVHEGEHQQTDGNASFLRAARSGNVEKIIEHLKGNIDINTSNANGLNALHLASKEGNVNVVTELLKRGANVNAATKKGNTALHIASLAGQEEVVRVLVQAGANVNSQSQNGFTPLYMAAQENHDSVVSFLLANGANQSLATEDGFTPLAVALQQGHDKVVAVLLENDTKGRVRLPALHIAAKKDDCKAATLLLQSDHNPDVTSKSGFTPLHIAAHYGNENIAKILLNKGADVNYAAKHQITPLHVASKWGKMNMVVLLLENGANIEASTRDGLTPLHCAARSGHDQVVDLLLEKGAPFLAKTKNGLAPLHMASQGDHVDSARILLYHKAPVDDVTVDYLTALHVAAHCGHVKVAKLLLDRKADPNARALNGFTPLHIACKKNRIKVVELLLKHGASIEATTESGLTPLHVASFMGCMNIVIYLIQNGANPDVPTVRGETPLHLAARANQTDIIRILLRNGASVDARAREEQTPLHIAARLGNVDIVSLLLQHGAAVDATTKDMYTALHIAAKEDQEEVAACLLDHGASLTSTTKKGFTPLHLAAKYGNIKVARLLIQKEAPVDAQGKNGVTPLHVAAHYDHVNVALLLLDKGASPHAIAKNGYTPLHIAAKKNQMDIASTLLEYGAKTNSESKAGFTPLHLASQEGHADMASLLIENKADVNHKANNGLTPLHLCAQDDRVNVAHILVAHKAEVDPQTKAGYTPLHVASHFGQVNMVRFLLQNRADVQTTTSLGYTPLHQAAQQGHTLVVNLLLENEASPNVTTTQGQTPLSIAQRLGYISVVETLKVVTETTITTTTTTVTEEKYKVVAPETMQETFMTDSEDEGGEEAMLGDQSYGYLTADEMKSLGDDSLPIDVTKDEKHQDILHSVKQFGAPIVDEDKLSPQHVTPVESGFSEKFSPDNIDLTRAPVHAGRFSWADDFYYYSLPKGMLRSRFLVSFMVDARGGAMRGCRHSGVRIIIPPRKASMPMRITCRYLRKEKLIHPPPLMEGEACASRILEMGPVGARFLGPVIIEVPHFASTRGKEREITILRSDTGESWREHVLEASEEAVQEVLNESFEGEELSALEDLNTNRITRILTTDFPQYFAIITRIRQEVHGVGPEGGMVSSTVVPQVQAIFPEGALTKKIRVGLQAQPIAPELVAKLLGNRVAVSPIVTVEPRRRKFHKPITLTIPVPQAATKGMINQYSGDAPTLRLLCSITGGSSKAQWEDVTGSTPLTFVNDCVSFTTTVSARFWLMDCRQVNEVTRFATELYQEAVYVPFMSKFVIFAKRHDPYEAQLRVFCMTDDKEDKTLECQEHFTEIAKSRDVEVLEGKLQFLEFAGNIAPVTKSGEQLQLPFQAFHENRLPFAVRVKDPHIEPMGRIAFMREPKAARGEPPLVPICNLNVALPEIILTDSSDVIELVTLEKRYDFIQEAGLSKPELIHRADLRLSDIAQGLDKDWVSLAQQLDMSEHDIGQIQADNTCDQSEQALMMLRLWLQKSGSKATGNELEKGLRKINREDIIKNCMFNVELVTDDVEKAVAKVHLDQSGFDVFKEELGSSRDASMRRGVSLDISYDEQDIMKEAESAAETSSETGSLFERDQISQALTDDKDLICQTADPSKCSADDNVDALFPKCKKMSNQHSVEAANNDLNAKVPSEPFDISESDSNIIINKTETNSILQETQTYAKQHEFWPSIPVTSPNGASVVPANSNCEQNLEKSNLNNKEISEHKDIPSKEESLNIIISENGNKSDRNAESCKSSDACDFGYCSMDKVTCASPVSDSDNASKSHSEQSGPESPLPTSPGLDQGRTLDEKALAEQTPELQSPANEDAFQMQPVVGVPLRDASQEGEKSLHSPGRNTDTGVSHPAAESTEAPAVKNESSAVCAPAGVCVTDGSPVTIVTTLQFEDAKSENSKDNDNADKIKEILLTQSTFENRFKEENLRGPVEVEQKFAEISGRQELPARLTESETWPSLELDTSQVSISSLPEDEKSEPTTATVSDAVALAADTDESTDDKEAPGATQVIQTTTVMTIRSPDLQPTDEAAASLTEPAESPHSPELSFAEKRDFFQKLSLSSSSNATPTHTLKASTDEKIETLATDEVFAPESPEEQLSFKECLKFFEKSADDHAPKPEIKDIKKEVWTVVGDEPEHERLDSMSDISEIERERELEVVEVVEKRRSTVSIDEQVSLPLHENKEVSETVFDSTKDTKVEVVVKTFVPGSEMLEICSLENIPQPGEVTPSKETIVETRVVTVVKKVFETPVEEFESKPTSDSKDGSPEVQLPEDDDSLPTNEEFISKTFKTFTESSYEVSRATIGAFKKDGVEKVENKWQRESPDNISIVKDKMEPSLGKSEIFICTEETLDNVKKILSVADAESNVVIHENEPSTSAIADQREEIFEKVICVQKVTDNFAESESKLRKDIVESVTETKPKVIELSEEEILAVEKSIAEASEDISAITAKVVELTEEEIRAVEESIERESKNLSEIAKISKEKIRSVGESVEKESKDLSKIKSKIEELSKDQIQAVEESVENTSGQFAKVKLKVADRVEKQISEIEELSKDQRQAAEESIETASEEFDKVKLGVFDRVEKQISEIEELSKDQRQAVEESIETASEEFAKVKLGVSDRVEKQISEIEELSKNQRQAVEESVENTSGEFAEVKLKVADRVEKQISEIEELSKDQRQAVEESIETASEEFAKVKLGVSDRVEKQISEIEELSKDQRQAAEESIETASEEFDKVKLGVFDRVEKQISEIEELSKDQRQAVEESIETASEEFAKVKLGVSDRVEKQISEIEELSKDQRQAAEESIETASEEFDKVKLGVFDRVEKQISEIEELSKDQRQAVEESIETASEEFAKVKLGVSDRVEKQISDIEELSKDQRQAAEESIETASEEFDKVKLGVFDRVEKQISEIEELSKDQRQAVEESIETASEEFAKVKLGVSDRVEKQISEIEELSKDQRQAVEESIETTTEEFSKVKLKVADRAEKQISEIEELSKDQIQAAEESIEIASEEFAKVKLKVADRVEKQISEIEESVEKASIDYTKVKSKIIDDSKEQIRNIQEMAEETKSKLTEKSEKEMKIVEEYTDKITTDITEVKTQFIEESVRHIKDVEESIEKTSSDFSEIKSKIIEQSEKHAKEIENSTEMEIKGFTEIKSKLFEQSEKHIKDVSESIDKSTSIFSEIKSKIEEQSEKHTKHVEDSVERATSDFSEIKSKIVEKSEKQMEDAEGSVEKVASEFSEIKSKIVEQSEKHMEDVEESVEKVASEFSEIKSKIVEQSEKHIDDVKETVEKVASDFSEIKSKIVEQSEKRIENVEETVEKVVSEFSEIKSEIVEQSEKCMEDVEESVEKVASDFSEIKSKNVEEPDEVKIDCSELISKLTEQSEKHMELFEKVSMDVTEFKTELIEESEKETENIKESVEKVTIGFTKLKSELSDESTEKIETVKESLEKVNSDLSEIKSKFIDKPDAIVEKVQQEVIKTVSFTKVSPESSVILEKMGKVEEKSGSDSLKRPKPFETDEEESGYSEKVPERESEAKSEDAKKIDVSLEISEVERADQIVSQEEPSNKELISGHVEEKISGELESDRSEQSVSRPDQIEFKPARTLMAQRTEQVIETDIEILKAKIQKEREMGLQFEEHVAQSVGSAEEKSDSCFSSLKDQSVEIEFLPVLEISEDVMKDAVDMTGHEALGTPCSFHKEMDSEDKHLESHGSLEEIERNKIISEFRMEKESPSAAGPGSFEKAEYEEVEKREEATLKEMIYKKSRMCETSAKETVQSVEVTQFTEHSTEIYNVPSDKLIEKFSSKKIHIESSTDGKDKAPHKMDKFLDSVTQQKFLDSVTQQQVLLPSDVAPVYKRTEEWLDQSGEMMLREVELLDSAENGLFEDRPPTLEDEVHKRSSPTAESFDDKARVEQCDTDVMMQLLDFVSRNDIEMSEVRTEDEAPDIEEDVSPTAEEEICSRVSCDELKVLEKAHPKEKSPECLKVIESENLLLSPQRSSFDSVTSPSRRDAPSENVETVLDLRLNGRVHPQSSLEVEVGSHDSEEYLEREVLPLSFVEEESGRPSQSEAVEGIEVAALEEELLPDEVRKVTEITTVTQTVRFEPPVGEDGAPVPTPQEVVTSISEKPAEVVSASEFREEKQLEGKTDEAPIIEHAPQFHEKTVLSEDHELISDDNYTRSVEEGSSEFVPCAFVNTAFAGADLIDKVEQGSPTRARSPYEVVRGEEEEETTVRTTYVTEVRRRPMLQNIPSEISEEDLVEREIEPDLRLEALTRQSAQTRQEDSLPAADSSTQKTVTSETVTYDTETGGVTKTTVVTRICTTTSTLLRGGEVEQGELDKLVTQSDTADSSAEIESADEHHEVEAVPEAASEQMGTSTTDIIDSSEVLEGAAGEQVMNGPGEVEYRPEYDYSDEYPAKWSEHFGDVSYSGSPGRDPSDGVKKSRYSSVSDDVIDYEIGEILKSDQQFEDIIERPTTPEPPVDEFSDAGIPNASSKAKKAVTELKLSDYELKDKDDSLYDDAEPISSPALSPDDSRSGFAYGMQFEKDVAEEAMDIDSDPYSEEKEPMYGYGMRYEREEEEDAPCYGDLYTHEEEDEDALENGDKVKPPVVKPKKEPDYDMLAGRKYFSKNVEVDEMSVSSLQEFEHLEAEIVSGRKSSVGSLDSLNDKAPNSKSGDHDDVSMSSLTEFERLERECLEVEKIDPAMQESITQLSEIEEGHESQASETSQEHKSDGCRDEELSIIDEYDHHLGDIDNIILNVESKDELPFQYVLKQVPKPSDVAKSEVDKSSEVYKTTEHATTAITFASETCMQQSRDHLTKSNGKNDDIDQDSLRDEVSLKPDSLAEDPRHEYLDSLHEGKCDEDDSLQGDIPDVMRDSLLEERHLEDDSLHEMDILPDESSLSMESSFAAAISHDSSRADDQAKGRRQEGLPLSATPDRCLVSSSKVEIVVSELPKCDIMLSSTDSLEQSSSAAAAFHFESESAMSTSLTGALASEDNTMISSTDTLEHEGRITFRYEDIPVDELEILVKDGRKVVVDSEGNIQTEYDMKHFLDSEDNLNDFNLTSKNFTEIKLPSTSAFQVQSALTSISYTDDPKTKYEQSATDESEEQSRFESSYSDPDVEVEEIHTTDEFGNPKVIKRIKKVITTRTQFSSSSSSENVEEKLKEFLREHAAGERAGLGEEVVQEERSLDDKGNVLLVRTVQQQVLTEPEVHSRTFTGPDAAALSEEYVRRFKDLDPTDDVCEYEKMDDEGNVVRVTQQVVIKPEVHSVSFSGPNAREQMEEYMRRFTASSQNGDASESQSFSTVKISTTTEQSQGTFPSERISHDLKGGMGFVQTTTSTVTPESSEKIVRTVTTTVSSGDDPAHPGASADERAPSS
ncbi:unnamed protein product [Larinioides sclopetarius]|uniref:Ankyrin-3 n=1 Tax=Larinioides sclopetarius TaxID=280406 RepID=A0AAV2BKQ2_9ARAC